MTSNEGAGATAGIKALEFLPTAAGAPDGRIGFVWQPAFRISCAMVEAMIRAAGHDLQIPRAIIRLVSVDMVNDLGLLQRTPKHLGGNKAMFVNVASAIRVRVIGKFHPNIAVRGYGSTALPPTIACPAPSLVATGSTGQGIFLFRPTTFRTWLLNHAFSITHRMC